MRIGYACQIIAPRPVKLGSCLLRNATDQRLFQLVSHNLDCLEQMLDYNIHHSIHLFRISSEIIPFGSHPVNKLPWLDLFAHKLTALGEKIHSSGMRVSMHPGQYTVLNSPDAHTVSNACADLEYHTAFLDSLGLSGEHKVILHIGGGYGDKKSALQRFIKHCRALDKRIKKRLVVENDDRIFTVEEVLSAGEECGIPVVFDNLHHQINPSVCQREELDWISRCAATWTPEDGAQKLHYAQQAPGKQPGSHSDTIDVEPFVSFVSSLKGLKPDIMLEVKDKNLSAIKCINCTSAGTVRELEREWGRYKYAVLERDARAYTAIRELLKDKSAYPVVGFYHLVQAALEQTPTPGGVENAARHVWGYFKSTATPAERAAFEKHLVKALQPNDKAQALKRHLWKLAEKYGEEYLLQSYYFLY